MYDLAFFFGVITGILCTLFVAAIVLCIIYLIIRHYE